jgi:hypothetical protein
MIHGHDSVPETRSAPTLGERPIRAKVFWRKLLILYVFSNPLSFSRTHYGQSEHVGAHYAAAKAYCDVFEMAILESNQRRPSLRVLENNILPGSNMPDVIRASL